MKILLIGATHGNEQLGTKLYPYIIKKHPELLEHVDFIIGNPRAYAKRVRFTESDLNRSYTVGNGTYEQQRANEIQQHINQTKPDIVLDMHTTSCTQPDCLIIGDTHNEMVRRFMRASSTHAILQVKPMNDVLTIADAVIAYEIPNPRVKSDIFEAICQDLLRFIANEAYTHTKQLYVMEDKIYKKDVTHADTKQFVNFEMSPLGFIPIMTGNNSYKKQTDYLGFKASKVTEIRL